MLHALAQRVFPKLLKSYLRRQHDQRHADHDHHVQLRGPNVRHKVTVANRRERHHDVVRALEQVQVPMAGPLEVLDATYAVRGGRKLKKLSMTSVWFFFFFQIGGDAW